MCEESETEKVIYAVNISDVQTVALEEFSRKLSSDELKKIENQIGNYFNWFDAIRSCIQDHVNKV